MRDSTIKLPSHGLLHAFAIVVDINAFTRMVELSGGNSIAQFVRDVLDGGVRAVEEADGQVLGFMGDAFFGVLPDVERTFHACVSIAKDLDRQCEWISNNQRDESDAWFFAPGGPGLKVGIEYGWMDVSNVHSDALGSQPLLIGPPINYASRITAGGLGNRILYGPAAGEQGLLRFTSDGPFNIQGKAGEPEYTYYQLDMSDIWREGERLPGSETYWG